MITRTTAAAAASCLAIVATLLPAARAGRDVRITYEENGVVEIKNFDLLVVACDPTALADVFDGRTDLEERVEAALERYTLGTSLWDVRRMEGEGNTYSVRISPDQLSASDGQGVSDIGKDPLTLLEEDDDVSPEDKAVGMAIPGGFRLQESRPAAPDDYLVKREVG